MGRHLHDAKCVKKTVFSRQQCPAYHPRSWGNDDSDGYESRRATQPPRHGFLPALRERALPVWQRGCDGDGHQAEDYWDPAGKRLLLDEPQEKQTHMTQQLSELNFLLFLCVLSFSLKVHPECEVGLQDYILVVHLQERVWRQKCNW